MNVTERFCFGSILKLHGKLTFFYVDYYFRVIKYTGRIYPHIIPALYSWVILRGAQPAKN